MFIFAFVSIGLTLANTFFRIDKAGLIQGKNWISKIKLSLLLWWLMTLIFTFITTGEIINQKSFDVTATWSYLTQTDLGKSYLVSLVLIFIGLLFNYSKNSGSFFGFMVSLATIAAPIFQSHSSGLGNHGLAIGTLLFHVLALTLWISSLIGWQAISEPERKLSFNRIHNLLLWVATTVVITGVINSLIRLGFSKDWFSKYGSLVILKIVLTLFALSLAVMNRKKISTSSRFNSSSLLPVEIFVLIFISVIGNWLTQIQPPNVNTKLAQADLALLKVGIPMPDAPTLSRIFWSYQADGVILGILIFAVALYIRGVLVLSRRGDKWPLSKTILFAVGISLIDYATSGGIGVYANFAFSFHMMAHMIIGMIAPIAIVLSSPVTLALRTLPIGRVKDERGVRGMFINFLHSPFTKIISNPVIALAIFDGSLFVLYFTQLFGDLMGAHIGHIFMNLHFLFAGLLFYQVIIGTDPLPVTVPHIVKIIILFAAMSIHAFFSIGLLSATTQLDGGYFQGLQRPWWGDYLADQKLGGSIGWAMSEIPILLALIAVFVQWLRSDRNETRRIDRAAERAAAMGEDDELAKYNKYLAQLSVLDQKTTNGEKDQQSRKKNRK